MAIFQFNMQLIGRSDGHSAVAAAAYRSGQKLRNDYTGTIEDYTKKNWIRYSEVMLPENAPPSYKDRENLWNAVEATEKGKNARLAREIEVALPLELTAEENIRLVRSFVQENFVKDGMIADVNIHCPPVRDKNGIPLDKDGFPALKKEDMIFRNPHAHILLTVRPMDENGNWMAKTQKEYLCKKGDETAAFTAEEFKAARKEGWEKQYQYYKGRQKVWMTPSEAFVENLKRVSKNPRSTPYGRRDEKTEYWNSPDALIRYRKSWEMHINQSLKAAGIPERVSSLSYEDRGMDTIPGIHLGPHTSKDKAADRYRINEDIRILNRLNEEIRDAVQQLEKQLQDKSHTFYEDLAQELAQLEAKIISASFSAEQFETRKTDLQKEAARMRHSITRIQNVHAKLLAQDKAARENLLHLEQTQKGARSASGQAEIQKAIQAEEEARAFRHTHFQNLLKEEGFNDFLSFQQEAQILEQMEKDCLKLEKDYQQLQADISSCQQRYKELCKYLPTDADTLERFRICKEKKVRSHIQTLALPDLEEKRAAFQRIVHDTRYHLDRTMSLAAKTGFLLRRLDETTDTDSRRPTLL